MIPSQGGAQLCEGTEAAGEGSGRNYLQSTTRHDGYEVGYFDHQDSGGLNMTTVCAGML